MAKSLNISIGTVNKFIKSDLKLIKMKKRYSPSNALNTSHTSKSITLILEKKEK